jgi:hypothetical protein
MPRSQLLKSQQDQRIRPQLPALKRGAAWNGRIEEFSAAKAMKPGTRPVAPITPTLCLLGLRWTVHP